MKFLEQLKSLLSAEMPNDDYGRFDDSRNALELAAQEVIAATNALQDSLTIKEAIRFRTLQESGLLDAPPEEMFDSLTELGARSLRTPCCVIDLIDKDRMYMVSVHGFSDGNKPDYADTQSWPLDASFCKNVVDKEATLVITDSREDPLVMNNTASLNGSAISYIGSPIIMPNGSSVGVMCVSDTRPRLWTDDDVKMVEKFTSFATQLITMKTYLNKSINAFKKEHQAQLNK